MDYVQRVAVARQPPLQDSRRCEAAGWWHLVAEVDQVLVNVLAEQTDVTIRFLLGIIWASPNTALGLLMGGIGMCFGAKIQVAGRAIEFHSGGVKWLLQQLPAKGQILAMTVGHVVLGQTDAALDLSRAHETVHVRQYERWGPLFLPAYALASVYAWAKGRNPYRDNIFEVEAYACDDLSGTTHHNP